MADDNGGASGGGETTPEIPWYVKEAASEVCDYIVQDKEICADPFKSFGALKDHPAVEEMEAVKGEIDTESSPGDILRELQPVVREVLDPRNLEGLDGPGMKEMADELATHPHAQFAREMMSKPLKTIGKVGHDALCENVPGAGYVVDCTGPEEPIHPGSNFYLGSVNKSSNSPDRTG